MKSAIGNSLLMSLVVVIVSLVMLVFVNILSYSKAYRVKNRIIEIIEKYEKHNDDNAKEEINKYLHQSGYMVGKYEKCESDLRTKFDNITDVEVSNDYKYCVGTKKTSGGETYYVVMTYVEYNFPVINQIISTSVTGETKMLGRDYSKYD